VQQPASPFEVRGRCCCYQRTTLRTTFVVVVVVDVVVMRECMHAFKRDPNREVKEADS
jgi:hypothetical protein